MGSCKSFKEFFVLKPIKKEPDDNNTFCSSNFFDEIRANLDLQKYHYKEELDLKWDEKDNNCYDENYETFVRKSIEKDEPEKIEKSKSTSILQNKNFQPRKTNVKIEDLETEKVTINENLDPQKYHYKEELDLSWDEKDNNYDETFVKKSTEKSKASKACKNKPISVLQNNHSQSRKKKKIDNPDTEKECPRCKKRLKNLNTLKKHLFYCGKAPHLQCDSCSYKAKYKNCLILHLARDHPEQVERNLRKKIKARKKGSKSNKVPKEQQQSDKCLRFCVNCSVSTDKSKLNKCDKCESPLLYQCRICNATFQSREKLTRHTIDKCDPKGYYHCPACDFKATIKMTVKFHLKTHLIPGSHLDIEEIKWKKIEGKNDAADSHLFTCPSCGKQFQRKASLASHMRFCVKSQGVTKPPTRYAEKSKKDSGLRHRILKYCQKCNKKDEIVRDKIQTSVCCGAMILYKCSKCNQCFEYLTSVLYHLKNNCYFAPKLKCDMCDYEGSKINLARHRQHKHDFNNAECPKCKTKLKNKNTLRFHSYYCGMKPLECDYCSYKTKRKNYLKLHILEKHPK